MCVVGQLLLEASWFIEIIIFVINNQQLNWA